MFIGSRKLINLDHVIIVDVKYDGRGGVAETIFTRTDGKLHSVPQDLTDEVRDYGSTIIPAFPGFELLVFALDANPDADPKTFDVASEIERIPVIGWRCVAGALWREPILPSGEMSDYGRGAVTGILWPTGQIDMPIPSITYPSLEAWINDHVRPEWMKDRQASSTSPQPK